MTYRTPRCSLTPEAWLWYRASFERFAPGAPGGHPRVKAYRPVVRDERNRVVWVGLHVWLTQPNDSLALRATIHTMRHAKAKEMAR